MIAKKVKSPLQRVASVLEAAQFANGSLDITLTGPEGGIYEPLKMVVYLKGEQVTAVTSGISSVAAALRDIAEAIRGRKNG